MQYKNVGYSWIFALALFTMATPVFAQNKKTQDDEIPPAENVSVESTDGVTLRCTWYASNKGKETVPIILVHDWGGKRQDMQPLAEHLQQEGHAVIVPDLRGHGESTKVVGLEAPLNFKDFKKAQIASLVVDIDTCKRFLMRRNNAAELNIEMLTVVATHQTAIHAVNWTVSDWAWPPFEGLKQGQDVKALFLISPVKRFKSVSLTAALKTPCMSGNGDFRPVIVTLFWGNGDDTSTRESESIEGLISKGRPSAEEMEDLSDEEVWAVKTAFSIPIRSSGVGTDLLKGNALETIKANVAGIVRKTLVENVEDFPWQDRSK